MGDPRENMKLFFSAFEKMKEEDLFTEEGWKKCVDSLVFLDERQREGFLSQFVLVCTQM